MNDLSKSDPAESKPRDDSSAIRPLRIWPGVALVVVMLIARLVPGFLEGGLAKYWMIAMLGPMVCCLLLVIWWLAASRATWKERLFGFLGLVAAYMLTTALVEPMMRGPGSVYVTLPMGLTAFVLGAAWFHRRLPFRRTGMALLLASLGFGFSALLRNDGMDGEYQLTLHWRWSPSAEEQWLASRTPASSATSAAAPCTSWSAWETSQSPACFPAVHCPIQTAAPLPSSARYWPSTSTPARRRKRKG